MPDHRPAAPRSVAAICGSEATTVFADGCARSARSIRGGAPAKHGACFAQEGLVVNRKKDPAAVARGGPHGASQATRTQACRLVERPGSGLLRAGAPGEVWALDFQFDTTTNGRILKLLHVVDEHTQNPFVESFGSRVRDEVLAVEAFTTLLEAKVVIENWRIMYNTVRPHSSLGWMTPSLYAVGCRRGSYTP